MAGSLKPDFNPSAGTGRDAVALTTPMFDLPKTYQLQGLPEHEPFSSPDFRQRGHSLLERDSAVARSEDLPMLRGTTVWQRLADFRSHGRLRLLTLWETGSSSISLQAGKRGEPSLQWTSRSMNRGGATRGLFDQLVSVSIARADRSFHPAARLMRNEPGVHPGRLSEAGLGAGK